MCSSLKGNRLGPDGAAALSKGLEGNLSLTWLDLEQNFIESEGAIRLAAVLKSTNLKQAANLKCA